MKTQTHTNPQSRRPGFTLTEILIAIGIMGVGMVMVGALFPVAAKEASISTDAVMGNIICHNSVGVIKSVLKHPLNTYTYPGGAIAPLGLNLIELTDNKLNAAPNYTFSKNSLHSPTYMGFVAGGSTATSIISTNTTNWSSNQWNGLRYIETNPDGSVACWGDIKGASDATHLTIAGMIGTPTPGHAFFVVPPGAGLRSAIVLGRQWPTGNNDYQFVIVSVAAPGSPTPQCNIQTELLGITSDPTGPSITITSGDPKRLQVGSPVIDLQGNFATIVSRNGNVAKLDHALDATDTQAYVITLRDLSNNLIGNSSPALSVLVIRTALPTN